jgi:hypothetical protein
LRGAAAGRIIARSPSEPGGPSGGDTVEMAAGILLMVLSVLIIVFVIRTVQSNMPR